MAAPLLSGPRISPRSGNIRRIVVLLHGYGASGDDLIPLGRQWLDWLPDTLFIAPHAPEPCPHAPGMRQWFPLTTRDAHERWRGAVSARSALDAFLNAELAAAGLDDSQLALVGFSQGSMMALHVGLRRPRAPAAIIVYSGLLIGMDRLSEATARDARGAPPPILFIHGESDDVVPAQGMTQSVEALSAAGIPVQWRVTPRLGHAIDGDGLAQGGLFLAHCFGLPSPPGVHAGALAI